MIGTLAIIEDNGRAVEIPYWLRWDVEFESVPAEGGPWTVVHAGIPVELEVLRITERRGRQIEFYSPPRPGPESPGELRCLLLVEPNGIRRGRYILGAPL